MTFDIIDRDSQEYLYRITEDEYSDYVIKLREVGNKIIDLVIENGFYLNTEDGPSVVSSILQEYTHPCYKSYAEYIYDKLIEAESQFREIYVIDKRKFFLDKFDLSVPTEDEFHQEPPLMMDIVLAKYLICGQIFLNEDVQVCYLHRILYYVRDLKNILNHTRDKNLDERIRHMIPHAEEYSCNFYAADLLIKQMLVKDISNDVIWMGAWGFKSKDDLMQFKLARTQHLMDYSEYSR